MKSTLALAFLAAGALLASDAAAFRIKMPTFANKCGPGKRLVFAGTRSERCVPSAVDKCKPNETRIMAMCKLGAASCPSLCVPKPGTGGGFGTKLCPKGQVWKNTCPPNARCIIGGLCVPAGNSGGGGKVCPKGTKSTQVMCIRAPCPALCLPTGGGIPTTLPGAHKCKAGQRLVFEGTRSEKCVPDTTKQCKPNETRVMAMCKPGARSCPSMCIPKPGGGTGITTRLCPPGQVWKNTCPPNARCLIGGRCEPAGGGTGGSKVCPKGTKSTQVMCIRAPCPALCLPVGGLKPIKVTTLKPTAAQ